jgi:pYEATS domain-containing protein involved in immunity
VSAPAPHCPSCGAPPAVEDRFCGTCGARLREVPTTPASGPPSSGVPHVPRRPGILVTVVALVIVAAVAVVALLLGTGGRGRGPAPLPPAVVGLPSGEQPAVSGVQLTLWNLSKHVGQTPEGRLVYDWVAYVAGPGEVLDQVESVTYELPGFEPAIFHMDVNRAYGFPLAQFGWEWGEIEVRAQVLLKSGATLQLSRRLELLPDTWR